MDDNNKINTDGGPFIDGDVNSHGDFVGRDVNNRTTLSQNLTINGSLIIAIVAVLFIGSIGIVAIIKRNGNESIGIPIATPTQLSHSGSASSPAALAVDGGQACIANYFSDVRKNEWRAVEVGARAQPMAFSVQNQSPTGKVTLGVVVTEDGQPLAAIKFNLLSSSGVFKIISIIDAQCQIVEDYTNVTQPSSQKDTLQNFDALKIQLPEKAYTVRFSWDSGNNIEFDVR